MLRCESAKVYTMRWQELYEQSISTTRRLGVSKIQDYRGYRPNYVPNLHTFILGVAIMAIWSGTHRKKIHALRDISNAWASASHPWAGGHRGRLTRQPALPITQQLKERSGGTDGVPVRCLMGRCGDLAALQLGIRPTPRPAPGALVALVQKRHGGLRRRALGMLLKKGITPYFAPRDRYLRFIHHSQHMTHVLRNSIQIFMIPAP